MNIILLEPSDWLSDDTVLLTGRRHQHLREVLRAQIGESFRVGLLNGGRGAGKVIHINESEARLNVNLNQTALPRHPCDLVLALPRPKMLRRVLRTVAEMGVNNVHLIHSARVEKSFWQTPLLTADRIQRALSAGLERAGDTQLPAVHLHRRFRPFVEDQLPEMVRDRGCWIAHPGSEMGLGDQRAEGIIMLGPEGGFVPFELELATSIGALPVHLGDRTLSVDTAVTAALAQTHAVVRV